MALNLSYKPVEVVSTAGMSESDWLDWRRKGIGGSDSSAVMGCSPFCTARDLYYDKRGIITINAALPRPCRRNPTGSP